jgi:ABC-type branched-subunit amino acid transport system ATPase component
LLLHVEDPGAVGTPLPAEENGDAEAPQAPGAGDAQGVVEDHALVLAQSITLVEALGVLVHRALHLLQRRALEIAVALAAHEAPLAPDQRGARVEQRPARALRDALGQRRHDRRTSRCLHAVERRARVRRDHART